MKKMHLSYVYFLALSLLTTTTAMAADSDGCWSGRYSGGSCLQYHTYQKDNKTYIKLRNVCDERLYVKWCVGSSCGADSLYEGQTKTKYEYITNARVRTMAVGSNKPSKDWVCAGKVRGWNSW